ncbi:DUF1398 family protein [Iodobacter sp. HSC-16F04]|uniref:DUF1398 family protein n=1 Tax=Iodobacter violaceini TaxID=3044271 RepID=A0ABX0KZ26_9NEIS|nr:DUF1398 family protein [Iodobacter violacea]NHQ85488.1 DUF1398 family protein [Iodobacter violacea]
MNANTICELARLTISGGLPFPEIVGRLIAEGVEYYHVDYVRLQFAFYGADGGVVVAPLTIEGLPEVASQLDGPQLRAAILDSQQNSQPFFRFSERAMEAGVQAYYVFLRGKRVSYLGRNGDCHVEWFPGAQHKDE